MYLSKSSAVSLLKMESQTTTVSSTSAVTEDASKKRWKKEQNLGIPVGVVRIHSKHIQDFRTLLDTTLGPPIRFRHVERSSDGWVLLHLPPVAALSLMEDCEARPALVKFLENHSATFSPWVRKKGNKSTVFKSTFQANEQKSNPPLPSSSSFRFVELFAGIGGFRLGLESIGGKCVLASELSPYAASIYRDNFQDNDDDKEYCCLVEGDILDLDLADYFPSNNTTINAYDMLTAGFPCQPFTTRGEQRGFQDDRGQLYREVARILQETQPSCFILENVSGLVTLGEGGFRGKRERKGRTVFREGSVFRRILHVLREDCGYTVDWKVLNSWRWLPQQRERVFIVGIRNDVTSNASFFNWNSFFESSGSNDNVSSDNNIENTNPFYKDGLSSTVRDILQPKDSPTVISSELSESQWKKVKDLHVKRNTSPAVDGCIDVDGKAPTLISSYHRISSVSTKYIFEEKDGTICDGSIGKRRPRFLTPRECCRIMGFPETYCINSSDQKHNEGHFYHGIGNAVTPPVVAQVGQELWRCVCDANQEKRESSKL